MKSFIVFAVCIGVVFAGHHLQDTNHYARHSQSVDAARRGARFETFEDDGQPAMPSEEICRLCARCGGSSSIEKIPSGPSNSYQVPIKIEDRPSTIGAQHTSSASQLGQSTSTSSTSSISVSSSSSSSSSSSNSNGINGNFANKKPAQDFLPGFPQGFPHSFATFAVGSPSVRHFISESDRAAHEQAQSLSSQSGHKSTTAIDYGTVEPLISTPSGRGHYNSWEKSSSWATQSASDSNGHHSSSVFSTGEGEDHTIDGKTTSYRAATTTVDDNGKRSTYSVRTP